MIFLKSHKPCLVSCRKLMSTSSDSTLNYCVDLVKKCDHDGFLCNLLLPSHLRATAFAIRSFNIEVSKVQEQTTEKQTGLMRLKFWDRGLDLIYDDKAVNHPVLMELRTRVKKHKLSKLLFKRLVTAREQQLNVSTFKDMTAMENYADLTCSSVLKLLLEAQGLKNVNCDHVASHIGRAQGLSNLIRGLPHNLRENIVLLPMTELIENNISEESLIRNSVQPDILSKVISNVASVANNHLKLAKSFEEKVPDECKAIFLPAVPVTLFLKKLEKFNFHIYEPKLSVRNGLLFFNLYWKKLKKTY